MSVAVPRVLVVSESRITRRVVEMTFADQPMQVLVASTGEGALEEWRSRPAAVVIADIAMAHPDGYEVAREVRSHASGEKTAVILLAAQAAAVDASLVAEHRVSAVLRKPLDSHQLIDAVRDALRSGPPDEVPAGPPAADDADRDDRSRPTGSDGGALAQTFHALLDVEQGVLPAFPADLGDGDVERVAERVASILTADPERGARLDRLVLERTEQLTAAAASEAAERVVPTVATDVAERVVREMTPRLVEEVARLMVADVSERLVREEIARLRGVRVSA
jgi:CheY-like chemotaxis protein